MAIPKTTYLFHQDISYVTMEMVKAHHTHKEATQFRKWCSGQTCMRLPNGTSGIYSWDYERWCQEGCLSHQLGETMD